MSHNWFYSDTDSDSDSDSSPIGGGRVTTTQSAAVRLFGETSSNMGTVTTHGIRVVESSPRTPSAAMRIFGETSVSSGGITIGGEVTIRDYPGVRNQTPDTPALVTPSDSVRIFGETSGNTSSSSRTIKEHDALEYMRRDRYRRR